MLDETRLKSLQLRLNLESDSTTKISKSFDFISKIGQQLVFFTMFTKQILFIETNTSAKNCNLFTSETQFLSIKY